MPFLSLSAKKQVRKQTFNPDETKALYVSGWTMGKDSSLQHFIRLANKTEINSYVIDIKEDDGLVSYQSQVPRVASNKLWTNKFNPVHVLQELHKNHIHVIGRIVCFKDPLLPVKCPELAIHDKNGQLWKDKENQSWLNPYNPENWKYLVDIAQEGVKLGFDEIQFDYVRFTQNGDLGATELDSVQLSKKYEAINGFLSYARQRLKNAIISADIFGIVLESPADTEGIGQYLELMGKNVDYLSPMVYPSHYGCGQSVNDVVFEKPDLEPYGVVYNALASGKERIVKTPDFKAKLRPYLQDFTASYLPEGTYQTYGPKQVREQIEAVYKNGYHGWIFWNVESVYSEAGFLPKKK
jgi:hypothetical protein